MSVFFVLFSPYLRYVPKKPSMLMSHFWAVKISTKPAFFDMHEFSAKIQKKKSQTDQKSDKLPSFFANHPCKFGVFELSEKKFFFEHAFRRKTEMVPFCERFSCDWVFLLIWGIAVFRPENSNAIILTEQSENSFRWQKSLMKRFYRFSQNRSTKNPARKKMIFFFKQSSI